MESPNYYAIIPANVRYSTELTPNEKLLYGEITALCGKTGECWATNKYFAKLYRVTPRVICRWINNLAKLGFIQSVVCKAEGNVRHITLLGIEQKFHTPMEKKFHTPMEQNDTHNNINNNNTSVDDDATTSTPKKFWVKGRTDSECWAAIRGCRKLTNQQLIEMAEGGPFDIDLNGNPIWRYGEGLDREAAFTVLRERARKKKLSGDA